MGVEGEVEGGHLVMFINQGLKIESLQCVLLLWPSRHSLIYFFRNEILRLVKAADTTLEVLTR